MTNNPPRATWLVLLRRTLLALAVLTTAAAAVVAGFAAYLFAEGYSGGSDQQRTGSPGGGEALAVGMPLTLAAALCWAGYVTATRKNRQRS